ncbi:MAG: protein-glutamate O-methyltransferase CheR [Candidatus Competibacteraceae bacterium]|nr:protein-glutamate O-methyltransferase CheR [Candidatus Competibacteraceae bacterium]MCP5125010.1 protein-glutamate O-methyltransferase CheR [Gammaproteobacteria bacterium]
MNATCASDFNYIRELVRRHSAIVLEADKDYLIETRLTPLARQTGFASLEALIAALRANSATSTLRNQVVEAITTHETSFFRDFHPFEALKTTVLPELLAKRSSSNVTIWCAACSSGQEPFSIAMLVREHFPILRNRVRIIATDLSGAILARAKEGLYSQIEVNRGLPAMLLTKYFQRQGLQWRIRPEIRQMVEFRQNNLAESWPPIPPLDIVFMRNVLIYFDLGTKKAILARIRGVLKSSGYLFLGSSETTLNLDAAFEPISMGKSVCYKLRQNQKL